MIPRLLPRLPWVVNASLALSAVGLGVLAARAGMLWRADFSAFYTGWHIVWRGQGAQLYDFELQTAVQQEILAGRSFANGLLPFNNPPHVALFFAPLASLPLTTAYALWTLAQFAILLALLRPLWQETRFLHLPARRLALITLLAFPPLMTTFLLGAFSLLLVFAVIKAAIALREGREVEAGLWLLAGTIKPQAVVLLVIALLAARRWRALAALAGGSLLCFAAAGLGLGWAAWSDFLAQLLKVSAYAGQFGIDPRDMYNLRGALAMILGEERLTLVNYLAVGATLAAAGWTLWGWRGARSLDSAVFARRMSLTLALGCFTSLHANPQDALLLVAPALFFAQSLLARGAQACAAFGRFVCAWPAVFFLETFALQGMLGVRLPIVIMGILVVWIAADREAIA